MMFVHLIFKVLFIFFTVALLSGCLHPRAPAPVQRAINAQDDMEQIYDEDEKSEPLILSLNQIIEIALENNYELSVKKKQYDAQYQFAIRDQLKMLPQLIANAELSHRNNNLIVSSTSVDPTIPPAPPSISTQKHVDRHDITAVLNLLDFGLAYYKAREGDKQALIAALEYEKTKQALILDIHKQYWKAIASKTAMDQSADLLKQAQELQVKIGSQIADRYTSATKGYKSTSDLQSIQVQFIGYDSDYYKAMSELSVMMGLPPGTCFELDFDNTRPLLKDVGDVCFLEHMALMRRPELYIKDVEQKISEDEIRYAFLQMLPGIELFSGNYFDANKYFTYHHWIVAGARATWNVLNIPNQFFDGTGNVTRKQVIKQQRLALSVGVLAQVRLAYILYQENYNQYQQVRILEESNRSLFAATDQDANEGFASELDVIVISSQALISKINAIKAYGELQSSLAQINFSIGSPEYFKSTNNSNLAIP